MKKLLTTTALALALVAGGMVNQAKAEASCSTFCTASPKLAAGVGMGVAWGGVMAYMIYTHQQALAGKKFAAVEVPVIGGEDYAQLSSATPLYGTANPAATFASVFQSPVSSLAAVPGQ